MEPKPVDEEVVSLFKRWLVAFESLEAATCEKESDAARAMLADIELRIASTPVDGLRGLVVKLGLNHFLKDQTDAASAQLESAYKDLVRLTGHDPASEISARFIRT